MYFTFVSYESSWGSCSQSPVEIPCPCFLLTVLTIIYAHAENFWCSRFSWFDCNIFFQDLVHTRLYGNERGTLSLFLRQVQKPCDVCLFGKLTSLPCKKQALPEELNKADRCQHLQHLSVLLKHCTGFYGKQRKIERQVRHDIMYLD